MSGCTLGAAWGERGWIGLVWLGCCSFEVCWLVCSLLVSSFVSSFVRLFVGGLIDRSIGRSVCLFVAFGFLGVFVFVFCLFVVDWFFVVVVVVVVVVLFWFFWLLCFSFLF